MFSCYFSAFARACPICRKDVLAVVNCARCYDNVCCARPRQGLHPARPSNPNSVFRTVYLFDMSRSVLYLSVPGLRAVDLATMPNLQKIAKSGSQATLVPSFPCVTWPVQCNMLCGCLPDEHGVVANGFYWRDSHRVEMWTAWNKIIQQPQIWDILGKLGKSSAAWLDRKSTRLNSSH